MWLLVLSNLLKERCRLAEIVIYIWCEVYDENHDISLVNVCVYWLCSALGEQWIRNKSPYHQ